MAQKLKQFGAGSMATKHGYTEYAAYAEDAYGLASDLAAIRALLAAMTPEEIDACVCKARTSVPASAYAGFHVDTPQEEFYG